MEPPGISTDMEGEDCVDGNGPSLMGEVELFISIDDLRCPSKAEESPDETKSLDFRKREHRDKYYLGGGSFGDVYHAYHSIHGIVAVKLAKNGIKDKLEYEREIKKHALSLTHDHIVRLRGVVQCDETNLFGIVMEYMKFGSLWNFRIKNKRVPDWPLANRMMHQMAQGMKFLHAREIIHRDLKAENVLLTKNLDVKIADIGLATTRTSSGANRPYGTITHKPPEAFKAHPDPDIVNEKYDIYGFSMTVYEFLTGIHPYAHHKESMIMVFKCDEECTPPMDRVPRETPQKMMEIMTKGLSFSPDDRPRTTEIEQSLESLYDEQEAMNCQSLLIFHGQNASRGSGVAEQDVRQLGQKVENLTINDSGRPQPLHGLSEGGVLNTPPPLTGGGDTAPLPLTEGGDAAPLPLTGGGDAAPQSGELNGGRVTPPVETSVSLAVLTPTPTNGGGPHPSGRTFCSLKSSENGARPSTTSAGARPHDDGGVGPIHFTGMECGQPIPVDENQAGAEYAVGVDQSKRQPLPSHLPAQRPLSAQRERETTVVFDQSLPSGDSYDIRLTVTLSLPLDVSLSPQMSQISQLLKRCTRHERWVGSKPLRHIFEMKHLNLCKIFLPESESGSEFTLLVRVSQEKHLSELQELAPQLPELLMDKFVDAEMRQLCSSVAEPVQLTLKPWNDVLKKAKIHFKRKSTKKTGAGNKKKQKKQALSGTSGEDIYIKKGDMEMTVKSLKGNIHIGDKTVTNHFYGGTRVPSGHTPSNSHSSIKQEPKKPQLSQSTDRVSRDEFLDVVHLIPIGNLKQLGRCLRLSELSIENLLYENRYENSNEQIIKLLMLWLEMNGQRCTRKVLAEALWDAKCYDAAREL